MIDVRTPEEYEASHIDGAERIGLADEDFDTRIGELDPDAAYVVYCRSGNRSAAAVDRMLDLGFTDLYNMTGGVLDWEAAGGELVTS